jgi:hypothetical protein
VSSQARGPRNVPGCRRADEAWVGADARWQEAKKFKEETTKMSRVNEGVQDEGG